MPISTGSISSAVSATAVSTFSWAHTVGTSDTLLVVGVEEFSTGSTAMAVSSVRLGSTAGATLTLNVAKRTTGLANIAEAVSFWSLVSPTPGTTLIHVDFSNSSHSNPALGFGLSVQGSSAVGSTVAGTSFSASGAVSATVTLAGAGDWGLALFGGRRTAFTSISGSSDTILSGATASSHVAALAQGDLGTSGEVTISVFSASGSIGARVAISLVETVAGGPSTLGIVQFSGSATVVTPLSVQKAIVPTFVASATVVTPLAVQKALAPTAAGAGSVTASLTVLRAIVPTADGVATVVTTFVEGAPVDLGTILFSGAATVASPVSVLRGLVPTADGAATVTAVLDSIVAVAPFVEPGAGGVAALRAIAQMRSQYRALLTDHKYAGTHVPREASKYNVYPGDTIPLDGVDEYELAELVWQETFNSLETEYETERTRTLQNLEAGRRKQRIDAGLPPAIKRDPPREKIVGDILERREREDDWKTKANMARVRSFKNRRS